MYFFVAHCLLLSEYFSHFYKFSSSASFSSTSLWLHIYSACSIARISLTSNSGNSLGIVCMPWESLWLKDISKGGGRVGVLLRTFVACHIVAAACAACNIVGATWCCRCCWRCFLFDSAYKCCNVQLLNSSAAAATFKWLRLPQKLCAFVPLKCNPQIVQNPEKKLCHILGAAETKQMQKKRINENSCCVKFWQYFWQRDFIWITAEFGQNFNIENLQ